MSLPSEILRRLDQESKRDRLSRRCGINTDNLVTIPKEWLEARIYVLSAATRQALDAALRFSLAPR